MVTAWSRRGEDWRGFWIGGDQRSWWHGFGVEIGGFSWLFDVVLLGLGAVSGFDGGSVEGFDGDFLKLVSWNMWGFGLV